MRDAHGEIHEFRASGNFFDDDGEAMIGFYFRIVDQFEIPLSKLTGPYSSAEEAEAACNNAYQKEDY